MHNAFYEKPVVHLTFPKIERKQLRAEVNPTMSLPISGRAEIELGAEGRACGVGAGKNEFAGVGVGGGVGAAPAEGFRGMFAGGVDEDGAGRAVWRFHGLSPSVASHPAIRWQADSTLDVYSHVLPTMQEAASQKMEGILFGSKVR